MPKFTRKDRKRVGKKIRRFKIPDYRIFPNEVVWACFDLKTGELISEGDGYCIGKTPESAKPVLSDSPYTLKQVRIVFADA